MARSNYWTRKLERRRFLAGSAAGSVGVAGLLLTGCGGDDEEEGGGVTPGGQAPLTPISQSPTPSDNVPKDGVLKSRQTGPFASINPYKGLDSGLLWGFTIFDHLFYTPFDTGIRENFLATKIEQPDPLTINIGIGEGTFHNKPPANGRAIKAGDIKASLESAAKQTKISNSSWWTAVLDSVQTIDDKNITVKLKAVDAWTFSSTNFGSPIASSIIPQELAANPDLMDNNLCGSGRFQFVSHENGTNFKIERNPNWRIKGEPFLAGIQYKLIQEQALALTAFSSQEIDSVIPNNKLERDQLIGRHGANIDAETDISRSVWMVQARGDGQWKNPIVQKAIDMALDRKEFITLMNFGDGVLSGPVPPPFASQALTDAEVKANYDNFKPGEAKAILAATGFDLNIEYELKFYTPGERPAQFAQIVQSQLQKNLGMKIKLVGEDFANWLANSLYGSKYTGFITNPTLAYDDPSSYIGVYGKTIGGRPNWAGFVDDELDRLVTQQKTILDDRERNRAVHDIQLKALEKGAPFHPVFAAVTGTTYWNHVKGRIKGRGSYGLFNGRVYIEKK